MSNQPAKDDYARVWLQMSRRALDQLADMADDEPERLFDDDEIEAAKQRHPANPEPDERERCGKRLPKSPWQLIWPRCSEPKGHDGPHWAATAINVEDSEGRL